MTDVFYSLPSYKYFIEYDWAEKQIWLTYCLERILSNRMKLSIQNKMHVYLLRSPNKAHSPLGIKLEASPSLSLSWKSSWNRKWILSQSLLRSESLLYITHFKSIVSPAAKLHLAALIVKWEPRDIDWTRGHEDSWNMDHQKNYGQSSDWIGDYLLLSLSPISTIG